MVTRTLLALALVLGISSTAMAATQNCVDPVDFGAIPNDGLDDAAAMMAAGTYVGNNGGYVCVPVGDFNIFPRNWNTALGNPDRFYSIYFTNLPNPVVFRGASKHTTRLIMTGDGIGGTWHMIGSERQKGIELYNMTFYGGGRTGGYAEHQMVVQFGYGTTDGVVKNMIIDHPQLGPSAGGDCISLVGGYTEEEIESDILIEDVEFPFCDRSAIGLQRTNQKVRINRVRGSAGDQFIDSEASDAADPFRWIKDLHVSNAVIYGHGGLAITLGRSTGVRLDNVHIYNGSIYMLTGENTSIRDTVIECPDSQEACITVRRTVDDFLLSGVTLVKPEGATLAGPLLTIFADTDGSPKGVVIDGGRFVQTSHEKAIFVGSAKARITNAEFHYKGTVPGGANVVGIVVNTTIGAAPADVVIDSNRFYGTWTKAALIGSNIGIIAVRDNIGNAETGISCELPGTSVIRQFRDNLFLKANGAAALNPGCI